MITTKFDKDFAAALDGDEREVITTRRNEIAGLHRKLRTTKNSFWAQCLAQEISRLQQELDIIESHF